MKTLENMTPHPVTIIPPEATRFDPVIRKHILIQNSNYLPVVIHSDGMLSVSFREGEERHKVSLPTGNYEIPFITRRVLAIDPIPEDADFIIASAMYAFYARRERIDGWERLVTIASPVYSYETAVRPVGCLGVAI